MTYCEFLTELQACAEPAFAAFQRKLIPTSQKILGVRTPALRKLAKSFKNGTDELFAFPDEYYETTFVKLAAVALLPYEKFTEYLPECLPLIDNWATCDCFKAACIEKHKDDFLPLLERFFVNGREFYQRYVLVMLLSYYVEEKYLKTIVEYLKRAETDMYYVHMAAAWLTAEVLVKHYEEGVKILESGILNARTHNKAIQKAKESYRITQEQKGFLESLKIKDSKQKVH